MYIDDGIAVGSSFEQSLTLCGLIELTLYKAGFVINKEKSKLTTQQVYTYLMRAKDNLLCDHPVFLDGSTDVQLMAMPKEIQTAYQSL